MSIREKEDSAGTEIRSKVKKMLKKLEACGGDPKKYEGGVGYWDDYCLTKFLEGVCLRYIAYPVSVVVFHSWNLGSVLVEDELKGFVFA